MAYNEKLANRVKELLLTKKSVKEKKMMGGLTFMVNNKMCVGILNDDLMARINPEIYKAVLDKRGCREMGFTGRPMKGFVFVDHDGTKSKKISSTGLALLSNTIRKQRVQKRKGDERARVQLLEMQKYRTVFSSY